MIIECPSCKARYVVPVSAFASGGRKVRCARCKNEWTALPDKIDIFLPLPDVPTQIAQSHNISAPPIPPALDEETPEPRGNTKNLPAVVRKHSFSHFVRRFKFTLTKGIIILKRNTPTLRHGINIQEIKDILSEIRWTKVAFLMVVMCILSTLLIVWPIMDRNNIVKAMPGLRGMYEFLGFYIQHSGSGLIFSQVKSELKYDSGTMKLYVDGVVHNTTGETQLLPDIKARAIGPDQHIIQSWWVAAPAAVVAAGSDIAFHTEVATPMQHTIDSVYLEFYSQEEQGDVAQ